MASGERVSVREEQAPSSAEFRGALSDLETEFVEVRLSNREFGEEQEDPRIERNAQALKADELDVVQRGSLIRRLGRVATGRGCTFNVQHPPSPIKESTPKDALNLKS